MEVCNLFQCVFIRSNKNERICFKACNLSLNIPLFHYFMQRINLLGFNVRHIEDMLTYAILRNCNVL
jgi:hypothetical protein